MKICVDVSPAVHGHAGIGRYTQELLAALLQVDAANDYVAFYNQPATAHLTPPLDRLPRRTSRLPNKPWRAQVLLAHLTRWPQDRRFRGIDVFHATDNLLPHLTHLRSVFTLHDLAFHYYPETLSAANRRFLEAMMPHFLRAADRIIAVSESTRRDAVQRYGIDENRIRVVYEGVSARFRPAPGGAVAALAQKHNLPARFILALGTVEPRKNLVTLLEAYRLLKTRGLGLKLVVVGKVGWLAETTWQRLRALGLEGEVILPGFIPDEDLPALYSASALLAFPSLYEGFGLPVLEAMACGTPVVCSNASSLPEVAGHAAILVDPLDVAGWAAALGRVLADEGLREEMRGSGMAQATRFSWERAARETLATYASLLNTRPLQSPRGAP
jgi:glycosyltransferase involved in cell wall biosynthesis